MQKNPEKVFSNARKKCLTIEKGFDQVWQDKVIRIQIFLFVPTTKGTVGLRFDNFPARALELGPLRDENPELPPTLVEQLRVLTPKGVSLEMVTTLAAYYFATKPEDTDWVVRPVANFDVYLGTTSFHSGFSNSFSVSFMRLIFL